MLNIGYFKDNVYAYKAMARKAYSSDLSDLEWEILAPLIPPPKLGGHPRTTNMREVCNAIYYQLKTGCQWNMLPGDFPPSSRIYSYYRKWQKRGVWRDLNHALCDHLREKQVVDCNRVQYQQITNK